MRECRIYTIGFGGWSREDLVAAIGERMVNLVVDVRSVPVASWQVEFSRENLAPFLADHGIRYEWRGDLLGGRPRDPDCRVDGHIDYLRVRRKEFFRRGIAWLLERAEREGPVCLLCSEKWPWECHRHHLVALELADRGVPVLHILPGDEPDLSPAEATLRGAGGQRPLFPAFHSRWKKRDQGGNT